MLKAAGTPKSNWNVNILLFEICPSTNIMISNLSGIDPIIAIFNIKLKAPKWSEVHQIDRRWCSDLDKYYVQPSSRISTLLCDRRRMKSMWHPSCIFFFFKFLRLAASEKFEPGPDTRSCQFPHCTSPAMMMMMRRRRIVVMVYMMTMMLMRGWELVGCLNEYEPLLRHHVSLQSTVIYIRLASKKDILP